MKIDKLKKYETKTASEPSPERIKQAREMFVNLLTPVIEKMMNNPGDIKPVSDSFESLARQAKSGIVTQPAIIQSETTKIITPETTKDNSGGAENSDATIVTKFNDEIKILNSLK